MASITIIIPAYNEEQSIRKTVEELKSQTGKSRHRISIVVVNDGSTDRTKGILERIKGISVMENGMNVFFLHPRQIFGFIITAFDKASNATKILTLSAVVFSALLIRHLTQGLLRLLLVKEHYFSKLPQQPS